MSHSLIGADRRTHLKIVVVALVGAVTLVGVVGAAQLPSERSRSVAAVVKAERPAVTIALHR